MLWRVVSYEDREYCEKHKDYYLRDIYEDKIWYGRVYQNIRNKYFIDGKKPDEIVSELMEQFQIKS
ncbi:MAG: hypothetical protein EOM11_00675 [Erysipelotrichia bacterium]|nr:hypothetical protein [Erysipelotrichia bacterium]